MTINFIQKKSFKEKAYKTLSVFVGIVTILNVSMVGALVAPKAVYADVGAITLASITHVSSNTYKASGSWNPQGNQCYTPGSGFHYKVYVYDDLNGNGAYDAGEKLTEVVPAACNGDFTAPVASGDRDEGGPWPASGQPNASFALSQGTHTICAVLIHVNNQGNDIAEANYCYGQNQEGAFVSGYKFGDTNGNGAWGGGEDGLEGWQINLTDRTPKTTSSSGYFEFKDVSIGSKTLSETQQSGWIQTFPLVPGTYALNLDYGDIVIGNFGNKPGQCALTFAKRVDNLTHPNGPTIPGDELKYTLEYQNTGTTNCTGGGVRIDDMIPAGTTYNGTHSQSVLSGDVNSDGINFGYGDSKFSGFTNSTGYNGSYVSWNAHVVSPTLTGNPLDGEKGTVSFNVVVNTPTQCGNYDVKNYAKIYADQIPSGIRAPLSPTEFVTTPVTYPCTPVLVLTKTVSNLTRNGAITISNPPHIGDTLRYSLNVQNTGNGDQTGYVFTDDVSDIVDYTNAPFDFVTADGTYNGTTKIVSWNPTTIAKGTIVSRTFKVTIKPMAEWPNDGDFDLRNVFGNEVKLGLCNLTLVKSVANLTNPTGLQRPGDMLEYTLNYANTGTADCTGGGVRIDDMIPAGTTYTGTHSQAVTANDTNLDGISYGYGDSKFSGFSNPSGFNGSYVSWNAHVVSPAETGYMKFRVTVNELAECAKTDIDNKGKIYADQMTAGAWSNTVSTHVEAICVTQLTLVKTVTNNNGGQKVVSDFPLYVNGNLVTSGIATNLTPGENGTLYTASEYNNPAFGYSASVWGGECAANGTITLHPGDKKTCTITNDDQPGTLIVKKDVINDNGGSKEADEFTMNVDGTNVSDSSFPGNEDGISVTLDAGSYTVTEGDHAGYDMSVGANCSGTIANGQTKTCTITNNDQPGTLIVKKVLHNDNGGTTPVTGFSFTVNDSDSVSFEGDAQNDLTLNAGTYNVVENEATGYTTTYDNCSDLLIQNGGSATCTITNDDNAPSLTLIKHVTNNNGGQAVATDWLLSATNGPTPISGQGGTTSGPTFVAGTYTLGETGGPSGYAASDWTCEGGDQDGSSITLGVGESATCEITNDDQAAKLIVKKIVVNDNGGTKEADNFTMTVDADNAAPSSFPGNTAGTDVVLDAGDYSVDEGSHDGYTKGLGENCSGTIANGETKTCVITNDDIAPSLTLVKHVTNNNGGQAVATDWLLSATNGPTPISGQGGVVSGATFSAGTYTLGETGGPSGYAASDWTCEGGDQDGSSITLGVGESATCEITNNDIAPTITLTKVVQPEEAASVNSFGLKIGDTYVNSGQTLAVNANTPYALDEAGRFGYQFVSLTGEEGCPTQLGGTVTLQPGENLSCTITNLKNQFGVDITKHAPATVEAGAAMTYTLDWSVSGNTTIKNVTVTDVLPANTTFASALNGGTYDAGTNTVTWALGDKNPGDSGTVSFTVNVATPLTNNTVIENTGKVCGTGNLDNDQEDLRIQSIEVPLATTKCDTSTTTTTVHSAPGATIQKSADPASVAAGQNVTWTITWSITGNAPATNVVITDPIPANMTFVSAADGGVYDAITNTITWTLGTKVPGNTGTLHFVTRAASPVANGTQVTNIASLKAVEIDPAITATATTTITSAPDLTITKTSDLTTFTNPGKTVNYTVVVTNKSTATDTAKNVVMTDTLPAGFTFATDSTSTKAFAVGNLTPGQSKTFTFLVNISGTQTAGTFVNTAKAKGNNTTEVTATTPVEVRVPATLGVATAPDLVITKLVNKKNAKPGDTIIYTLTIKNIGDGDATNVVLTDTLPKGLSFINSKGATRSWDIGTLQPGRSRVVNVDVRVNGDAKKGTYTNVGSVTSDEIPKKEAKAAIAVTIPKVLGLATTGTGSVDYALASLGALLVILGIRGLRRKPEHYELA